VLWLFVAVRVLVNPLSNVFQKLLTRQGAPPAAIVGWTHGLLAVAAIPLLIIEPPPVTPSFWISVAVSAVLAVVSNVLLVRAVEITDLSILGPINSYKAVVSLIPGIILLNEIPSWSAFSGVALIVVGSNVIADQDLGTRKPGGLVRLFSDRGIQYRMAALVLSAIEAVYLKRALLASAAAPVFAVWSVLGFVLLLPLITRFRTVGAGRTGETARRNVSTWLMLGVTTGLMQYSTLVVFGGFQVAAALALFQTSTLVSVLLGWRVFREPHIARRLLGSAIMASGAILIVMTR
jgi:drug/metabolite transporter (DMT)-like permease